MPFGLLAVSFVGLSIGLGASLSGCGDSAVRRPVTLAIEADGCGPTTRLARGFTLDGHRVVTVAHTLRGAVTIRVDGRPAELLALDHRRDLAVLGTRPPAIRGRARLSRQPANGSATLVRQAGSSGTSADLPLTIERIGLVTMDEPIDKTVHERDGFVATSQTDEIDKGESGSPILGADGRVVGVLFANDKATGRTAFAVSAAEVQSLLATTGSAAVGSGACDW